MVKRINIVVIVLLFALMFAAEYLPSRLFRTQPTAVALGQPKVIRFGGDDSFAYNPATVTIKAGESVIWQGEFTNHPLGSDTQEWSTQRTGNAFSYTFKRAGSYRFYCEVHGAPGGAGMSGVVIVQ